VLAFPIVEADALQVIVTATNGDPHARVYEIRVYERPMGANAADVDGACSS
jgi:hypothetical protein